MLHVKTESAKKFIYSMLVSRYSWETGTAHSWFRPKAPDMGIWVGSGQWTKMSGVVVGCWCCLTTAFEQTTSFSWRSFTSACPIWVQRQ